jgi:hypothetical protein
MATVRLMARPNFPAYPSHRDERLARGDRHERELQVLQKTAINDHPRQPPLLSLQRWRHQVTQDLAAITHLGATRHSLDLDLAHDLGERIICTASLRSI